MKELDSERRVNKDRRKQKFGRRGPKWLIFIPNLLTKNNTIFYIYLIISIALAIFNIVFLMNNLNAIVLEFYNGVLK